MECNKDEALRAKSIAEDKFNKNDFLGAKKFALKAQALFPSLDGISQMLATLDVYISAENKVSGEMDWYGVLGVNPSADEETMKKQYKKLALLLHPDKNRSLGAEGAFRLISDAWTLLSDQAKRLAYNQRRGSKSFQQRVPLHPVRPAFQQRVPTQGSTGPGFQQRGPTQTGQAFNQRPPVPNGVSAPLSSNGSVPSQPNGFSNGGSRKTSIPKKQSIGAKVPPPPAQTVPSHQRMDTFWTICRRCKIHFEYFRMYLNKTLLCPNCKQPFVSKETSPPIVCSRSQNSVPPRQKQPASGESVRDPNVHGRQCQGGSNSDKNPPNQQCPQSGKASSRSTEPSIAIKAATVVQQTRDKLKRLYTELYTSAGSDGSVKCQKVDDINSSKAEGRAGIGDTSRTAKSVCQEKECYNMCSTEKHKTTSNIEQCDQNKNNDLPVSSVDDQLEKSRLKDGAGIKGTGGSLDRAMSVPDPDFYDFDQDRTTSSFGDNEVWAGYDDIDGMPRFYALINKVVSRHPFELKISWLHSTTNTKTDSKNWVGSSFYRTVGEFRVDECNSCKNINTLSHRINWSKGPRGTILIFPKKDEVWAVFKNWKPDWDENTPSEVIFKYDMVMVLEDYNVEKGLTVAPLTKVPGYKTVFHINSDPETIKKLPKEEMFRFSHRVPSHVVIGHNAPKGCIELDPAAIPLEFLKVHTTEAK